MTFPFDSLPEGEVTPRPGPGDLQELLQRDIRIVRWFIEEAGWTGRRVTPGSTLGQLLAASEKVNMYGAATSLEAMAPEAARHGLHLTVGLVRLAWAIRALHRQGGALDRVDASFINDELLGNDSRERDAERTLPAGIGTMVFAGRLVQAGRGRISINGHGGVGHDLKWVTGSGDTVYVERKDRSYEAGLADTPEKRIRRVIQETRDAGLNMPRERHAARVLVVGFQHLVRKREAGQVDRGYQEALEREFGGGRVRHADLPNFVVVEHLGLEPRTDGAKYDFFSPQVLAMKPRETMRRVGRLLMTALGRRMTP